MSDQGSLPLGPSGDEPHEFKPGACAWPGCGKWHTSPVHRAALPTSTPLARDAGDTQRDSNPVRSAEWKRNAVIASLRSGPLCDYAIEQATGLIHQHASASRNGLMLAGVVTLVPDDGPTGRRHPLKRKRKDGSVFTASMGPWRTVPNPDAHSRKARVLVWALVPGATNGQGS